MKSLLNEERKRKIALIFNEPIAPDSLVSHNNINIILAPMMTRFNRVNCLNIRSSDSWLQGRGGYSADIRVLKVDNLNWSQALKSRQDFPRTGGEYVFNFVGKWKSVITSE